MFWKTALFLFSGKEAPILVDYSDQAVLMSVDTTVQLLVLICT
jgi:hypothetical protein